MGEPEIVGYVVLIRRSEDEAWDISAPDDIYDVTEARFQATRRQRETSELGGEWQYSVAALRLLPESTDA